MFQFTPTELVAIAVALFGGGGLGGAIVHFLENRQQVKRQESKDAGQLALDVAEKYREMADDLQQEVVTLRNDLDEAKVRLDDMEHKSQKLVEMSALLQAALREINPNHPLLKTK